MPWKIIAVIYLLETMQVMIFGKNDLFEFGAYKNRRKIMAAIKEKDRLTLLRCIPILVFSILLLTMVMVAVKDGIIAVVSPYAYMSVFKALIVLGIIFESVYLYWGTKNGFTIGNTRFYIIFSKIFIFVIITIVGMYVDKGALEVLKQSYKLVDTSLNMTKFDDATKIAADIFNKDAL